MQIDEITFLLVRGRKVPYMGIEVKQPTIQDLDKMLLDFGGYKFIYSASKDFLKFEDGESIEDFKDYTYFQTLFKSKNTIYLQTLVLSLIFFLEVDKLENIEIDLKDMKIVVNDDNGNNLFILADSNFEEFSELIRLICCCEKMVLKEEKIPQYKDESLRKKFEKLLRQNALNEARKKQENELTISDVIGAICINENTKYTFKNIEELTIWQLFYTFTSMLTKENIEILKSQFISGNYKFEKVPDMDWVKKVKVVSPDMKLIQK